MVSDAKEIVQRLSQSALFAYFTTEELGLVMSMIGTRRFRKGEIVFKEGDVGQDLYLIEEGRVIISKAVKGKLEQVLAHLGPGEHFGEMAVLEKIPRTASATAEEDCTLLIIGEDDLLNLMDNHPKAAAKIMFNLLKTFSRRLQSTNEQVREAIRWGLEATGFQLEV